VKNLLLAVALAASSPLAAQQIRGTITDSSTKQPVGGAVVMLLDSANRALVRNISDETGLYALPLRDGARRLRVQRIGFRPRDIELPARPAQVRVDVAVLPIAAYLETVNVSATQCSPRRDRGQAMALFEQAKLGLLATIVAREANPARMVMYGFERTMDGVSDRVIRQTVGVDSAISAKVTFSAATTGKELVESGFVRETQWGRVFLAPDADVLLGNEFAFGYCFSLARTDTSRPNQLGIAFDPSTNRQGRVDIQGTLWVDTLKRALVDLEFAYAGLPRREVLMRPGGHIEFREMPNGAVLVDRWLLRLIAYENDSIQTRQETAKNRAQYQRVSKNYVSESGGELAQARWRDGRSWRATMGTMRITGRDSLANPVKDVKLVLEETPYFAMTDTGGVAEITDLVPGPYTVMVDDPSFRDIGVLIPTSLRFTARRAARTMAELRIPTAREFIYQRCVADKFSSPRDSTRILFRAMTHTGEPIADVDWKVSLRTISEGTLGPSMSGNGHRLSVNSSVSAGTQSGAYRVLRQGGFTGSDGMFQLCLHDLHRGATLLVHLGHPDYADASFEMKLTSALQVIRLNLVPRQ
jgi:hypothetical protein